LQHAVLAGQGLIQEQGYKEQAQSYTNMTQAAGAKMKASTYADITAGIQARPAWR
jgi:hypothetical protein